MPKPLFRFHKTYFLFAVALFITEVLIALFADDAFIRPYFGDFLVVILLYCFVRSFLQVAVLPLVTGVFLFACLIEFMQAMHLVDRLGLKANPLARAVLGSSFEWRDILLYALGVLFVWFAESRLHREKAHRNRAVPPKTIA